MIKLLYGWAESFCSANTKKGLSSIQALENVFLHVGSVYVREDTLSTVQSVPA